MYKYKRSLSRRESIEILSDMELTSDELNQTTELKPATLTRSTRRLARSERALVTICYRAQMIRATDSIDHWTRFHLICNHGQLIFSNPTDLKLDSKLIISNFSIREQRVNGKGAVVLYSSKLIVCLRFKDRVERRKWLRLLERKSKAMNSVTVTMKKPSLFKRLMSSIMKTSRWFSDWFSGAEINSCIIDSTPVIIIVEKCLKTHLLKVHFISCILHTFVINVFNAWIVR